MYTALDVAMHVVNYINDQGGTVSNLKLQKLLYFVQGFFLILKDGPCFEDEIEAWDFGPVVPEVYFEFRRYGSCSIPSVDRVYDFSIFKDFGEDLGLEGNQYIDHIARDDVQLINDVVNSLKKYSASTLVRMTREQDPWKKTYDPANIHKKITLNSIDRYFRDRYLS